MAHAVSSESLFGTGNRMKKYSKILLVEDETLIAISLGMQLETAGYTICGQIGAGENAINAVREHEPDLIIMDINLAGSIDGIEAAKAIRQTHSTPIIFMTGYLDSELDRRALELNPLGLLRKPLRFHDLEALI